MTSSTCTTKKVGFSRIYMNHSGIKKARIWLKMRAFLIILGFSRILIWWRRGDLNPRPSARGLKIYMFSVVY